MNTSNSKLTAFQKIELREMIADLFWRGGSVFSFPDLGVTVACAPMFDGSRMWGFATSIASPDEQKFRAKVGKFWAIDRLNDGEILQVPEDAIFMTDEHTLQDKAHELAYFVSP